MVKSNTNNGATMNTTTATVSSSFDRYEMQTIYYIKFPGAHFQISPRFFERPEYVANKAARMLTSGEPRESVVQWLYSVQRN